LIGNPLIVMVLMGLCGYSKSTGFMAGLTVAQISEFSLILISLGVELGHINQDILSFVTVIGLITIAGSTYMIIFSEKIYSNISKYLNLFEKKNIKDDKVFSNNYEYILIGENKIGFSIMKEFIKSKKKYLILDYNPTRVNKLKKMRINCVYGDASEEDLFEDLNLSSLKLLASTVPDFDTNLMILKKIKEKNKNAINYPYFKAYF
jgi:hypothetical protein